MTKLKEIRLMKKMKQIDLAKILNVKPSTVNIAETKGIYDTRMAVKYAKALKCNPFFLLEGLDNN